MTGKARRRRVDWATNPLPAYPQSYIPLYIAYSAAGYLLRAYSIKSYESYNSREVHDLVSRIILIIEFKVLD